MRFLVDREKLCEAVTNLSRAVTTKASLPVLEGILMEAENGKLKMTAYNLDIGMIKTIDINCAEEGKIVFKAKLLGDILRSVTDDTVSFEVNEKLVCKIKCGSALFDILGLMPEFPEMPKIDNCERVVFPCETLKDLVRQTVFATAGPDNPKPVLQGLYFNVSDNGVKVVGVDGYRMAIRNERLNLGKNISFLVSAKFIAEAVKIIKEENEEIEFFIGDRHVSAEVDGYTVISRKIEGSFIDYEKIIPTTFATSCKVSTKELISIFERISLIISDPLRTAMRCKIEKEDIIFSCATTLGRATDTFVTAVTGDEFEIGINNRFFIEALRACETDEVILNMNGPFQSIVLKPTSGDEFLHMIMPTRLKAE